MVTYVIVATILVAIATLGMKAKTTPITRRISHPTLGVLNLAGQGGEANAAVDLAAIAPLFSAVRPSDDVPPPCDVLLVYCQISADGSLAGTERRLREIIRDAGASVVVVANEHSVEHYIAASPPQPPLGRTNLVMTLARNDPAFSRFLGELFSQMKRGIPITVAWSTLVPTKSAAPVDIPEMIFSNEIRPVAFA